MLLSHWKTIGSRACFICKIFFFISFSFVSLSVKSVETYLVGRDPNWVFSSSEAIQWKLNAFTGTLMDIIAKEERLSLRIVDAAWNQLYDRLQQGGYDAVLALSEPTVLNTSQFSFSCPLLLTGPVLVVSKTSSVTSLKHLKFLPVGAFEDGESEQLLQDSEALVRSYTNVAQALENVSNGTWSAALVPNIKANIFIKEAYAGKLKIISKPLSTKGYYLLSVKRQQNKLMKRFNQKVEALQKDGRYDELLQKFGLL